MHDEDAIIDDLILQGALEVVGIDGQTGEFLYSITSKLKEIMPELYDEHMNSVNKGIMDLWEKGFVDIDFNKNDPIVTLSLKSHDINEVKSLPKDLQWALQEIKRSLKI
jgi:hypothetical protein